MVSTKPAQYEFAFQPGRCDHGGAKCRLLTEGTMR